MSERLVGKRALVTGAGAGIGAAIARAFCAEGARTVVTDVDAGAAAAVAGSLGTAGGEVRSGALDVTDDAAVAAVAAEVDRDLGGLDVLVCNAGGTLTRYPRVLDAEPEYWDRMMALNLRSAYVLCRTFVPLMREGGCVVAVASVGALAHRTGFGVYGTAKAGLVRLVRAIAVDYAPQGIRANVICPGTIGTPAIARMLDAADDPAAAEERQLADVPVGRFGEPDEVGRLAVFLASDEAAYMTGTVQVIDGGFTLG